MLCTSLHLYFLEFADKPGKIDRKYSNINKQLKVHISKVPASEKLIAAATVQDLTKKSQYLAKKIWIKSEEEKKMLGVSSVEHKDVQKNVFYLFQTAAYWVSSR